jgi:hypothetical protein
MQQILLTRQTTATHHGATTLNADFDTAKRPTTKRYIQLLVTGAKHQATADNEDSTPMSPLTSDA